MFRTPPCRPAALLVLLLCSLTTAAQQRPNIVFLLVDDLGWTDLGYAGSTFYESPNIDRLSRESVQFTGAYASGSVCSPSRAAILTGKHPARVGITDWIPGTDPQDRPLLAPDDLDALPLAETTLAEVLAGQGYRTFFAGKWHLGGEGHLPTDQGFQTNVGGTDAGSPPGGYYAPYDNPELPDGPDGEFLTDRLTDESLRFLDTVGEAPFLLYLSFYTVHTPIQGCDRYEPQFEAKLGAADTLPRPRRAEGDGFTVLDQHNPAYASMVYALDENVGRLLERLKATDRYDNTIIVFTSDNGGLSTLEASRPRPAPTSVLPLRAGKGWLYEGGIRVPLLIKPADYDGTARISDAPVVGHDLFPTLLGLAGVPLPEPDSLDGADLRPLLTDAGTPAERDLFWHYPHYHGSAWTPGAALRRGKWKLIDFEDPARVELYDLETDLAETTDLAARYPEVVDDLLGRLRAHQVEVHAKSARPNPELHRP